MLYTVFHHQPLYMPVVVGEPPTAEELGWPEMYVKVAVVEAQDLEEVYRKTQHLEFPWWENPGVKEAKTPARSTSSGDVVQGEGGQWVVATFGFKKMAGGTGSSSTSSLEIACGQMPAASITT